MSKIFSILILASLLLPNFAIAQEASTTSGTVPEIISTSTPPDTGPISTTTDATVASEATSTTRTATSTLESTSTTTPATTTLFAETSSQSSQGSDGTAQASTSSENSPTIISGDAVAMANILNLVNTNFVNSNGVILFSNFFDYIRGSLDLRNASSSLFDGFCLTQNCSGNNTSINISNQAVIDNFLLLQALTGGNNISSSSGTSTIDSGDAYAGLNLINLANTNFVDSEYLLVTLNAFNGVGGDIVFPSLSNFFNSLRASSGSVQVENEGSIENNVNTTADTGGNSVEGGSISTGSASSTSNVFNQLNTTVVGGANVSILFRVHGDWAGEIFGAPDNLGWTQSPDGSIYLFDTQSSDSTGSTSSPQAGTSNTNVTGSNSALIRNNVTVMALTGDNKITGPGTGLIQTGNAVAGANIVNIANSNIIGRNWIMAIVNIFGDFKGNIAFGRPDLWVGEQVGAPNDVYKDSVLEYKFTIINNGDSPATKVKLLEDYDSNRLQIISSSYKFERDTNGNLLWDIGTLPPGKATEISYQAKVISDDTQDISNSVSVSARETDNNTSDNSDTAVVKVKAKAPRLGGGSRNRSGGGGSVLGASTSLMSTSSLASIEVLRMPPIATVRNSSTTIEQKLTVANPTGETLKSIVFKDILRDPTGEPIHIETWNLGDILPHEEVVLSYEIEFNNKAKKGFYSLSTRIESNRQKRNIGLNGLVLLGSLADIFGKSVAQNTQASLASADLEAMEPESLSNKPHVAFAEEYIPGIPETGSEDTSFDFLPIAAVLTIAPLLFLKLYQILS